MCDIILITWVFQKMKWKVIYNIVQFFLQLNHNQTRVFSCQIYSYLHLHPEVNHEGWTMKDTVNHKMSLDCTKTTVRMLQTHVWCNGCDILMVFIPVVSVDVPVCLYIVLSELHTLIIKFTYPERAAWLFPLTEHLLLQRALLKLPCFCHICM